MKCIELIASENFTSKPVLEVVGSCLTNKYSEGQVNNRYYGGNHIIDKIEQLCKDRALAAFGLEKQDWGVNVQALSGSPANFAAYTALLEPGDRLMGLDLPSGGHLSHGFVTPRGKKISATSVYFESKPYFVDPETGRINFKQLEELAMDFRPKLIICGFSAYPRFVEFAKFREVADKAGAMLMGDMAHISGLVATGVHPSPFEHCDVVTTTTHKSLRGPRSGMIFYNKKNRVYSDLGTRVDEAVFPGLQGGPHNHTIGALAAQLREVNTPEFKVYSETVVENARVLGEELMKKGHKLATDGTDNHLVLWDLRPHRLTGNKVERVCEECSISLNRNTLIGDKSALRPGGVRVGAPAMTTRGCNTDDFRKIAGFLDRCVQIARKIQSKKGKRFKRFNRGLAKNEDIIATKKEVEEWASKFFYPS